MFHLLKYALLFGVITTQASVIFAKDWSASELGVEVGSIIAQDSTLTVAANPSGQILISVPSEDFSLDKNFKIDLKFAEQPPRQVFVVWQTHLSKKTYQQGFNYLGEMAPAIDMRGIEGWSGKATSIELGFITGPGQKMSISGVRLFKPGVLDYLHDRWADWSEVKTWHPVDLNMYTGTKWNSTDPFPAQFFAMTGFCLVIVYLLLLRRRATLSGTALIIFTTWLALDSFWQLKLWHQVTKTTEQYGSLSSHKKVLASEHSAYAGFADAALPILNRQDARIFIAGTNDYEAMSTAYYLSPKNVFWDRRGIELPDASHIRSGDFIVLLRKNSVNYNPSTSLLSLPGNKGFRVEERLSHRVGTLIEVM
ncbi:MAG: hypothetical protein ABJK20_05980 [Halieaceae bacterium]